MAANSKNNVANNNQIAANKAFDEMDADVLYQRLGNTWFAFSVVGDDVFMAPVSEEQISEMKDSLNDQAIRSKAA
jgi:hypothetical protein